MLPAFTARLVHADPNRSLPSSGGGKRGVDFPPLSSSAAASAASASAAAAASSLLFSSSSSSSLRVSVLPPFDAATTTKADWKLGRTMARRAGRERQREEGRKEGWKEERNGRKAGERRGTLLLSPSCARPRNGAPSSFSAPDCRQKRNG